MVDIKVQLIEGSYHEVDSSERAFKIAGSMAVKEALKRSKPKLLEPMMAVEVVTPEDYLGDVMGNLNSRRGRVEHLEPLGNSQSIKASVPLSEMFGYATDLRSMTQGRATFTMQFDRYEDVPAVHRGGHRRRPGGRVGNAGRRPEPQWQSRSSSGRSRTSTSARSVTSTTGRRP